MNQNSSKAPNADSWFGDESRQGWAVRCHNFVGYSWQIWLASFSHRIMSSEIDKLIIFRSPTSKLTSPGMSITWAWGMLSFSSDSDPCQLFRGSDI